MFISKLLYCTVDMFCTNISLLFFTCISLQGSMVGARAVWDNSRDSVVTVSHDNDYITCCCSVYFIKLDDDYDSDESE